MSKKKTTAPFAEGTKVRLNRDVKRMPPFDHDRRKGDVAYVESYVPAEESEDGVPFYWLDNNDGTSFGIAGADAVELVMDAKAVAARRPPTVAELFSAIGWLDDPLITGCSLDGSTVTLYGETDEGLEFSVDVTFSKPTRVGL